MADFIMDCTFNKETIKIRLAQFVSMDVLHLEQLNPAMYKPGKYYNLHHNLCGKELDVAHEFCYSAGNNSFVQGSKLC